jgi:hypothetical protein
VLFFTLIDWLEATFAASETTTALGEIGDTTIAFGAHEARQIRTIAASGFIVQILMADA